MQSYFLSTSVGRERNLRNAQIPFEPFKIGRQKGLVFDGVHLPRVLQTLCVTVERQKPSRYDGVQVLYLKRARRRQAHAPAIVAEIKVATWGRFSDAETRGRILTVLREFNSSFGVREIVLHDNDSLECALPPQSDQGTFHVNLWTAPVGRAYRGDSAYGGVSSADHLWEYRISPSTGYWKSWHPSGQGQLIVDSAGTAVAELVGNNLYILYPLTDNRIPLGPDILRRILEEALYLRMSPEEVAKHRLETQKRRNEELFAEAKTHPVVVKRWDSTPILKEKFTVVANDFVQAFGGKQIQIHDYCDDPRLHRPSVDGRVHICIWSSSESPKEDDFGMQRVLFGAPLVFDEEAFVIKQSDAIGVPLSDEEGNNVGKLIGDTIYIHYPLVRAYIDLKWNNKGPEALFRRILEEAVFMKTATEEQKNARVRVFRNKNHARSREQYVTACSGRLESILAECRGIIEKNPRLVREQQINITRLIRETAEASRKLRQTEISQADAKIAYAKEFDKLCEIPKIRQVCVKEGLVQVFTDILYCVDPRTRRKHEIGAFRIDIYLRGDVIWDNLTRKVNGFKSGMNAPHVWSDGTACLGNMSEVIPQLAGNYEFAALAMVCIQFIENVNVNDQAGEHINKWPLAA